jgi:hypothetical protein
MAIEDILFTLRQNFKHGLDVLPLSIGIISFFIFVGTFNMAHLFMAINLLLILPIVMYFVNLLAPKVFTLLKLPEALWQAAPSESFLAYWPPATAFVISYIFMNAYDLYNLPEAPPKDKTLRGEYDAKVSARKAHSAFAMAATLLIGILLLGWRAYSGTDSALGFVIGTGFGVGTAVAIYRFMVGCGLGLRNSDVFGISTRIVPSNQDGVACYPVATAD